MIKLNLPSIIMQTQVLFGLCYYGSGDDDGTKNTLKQSLYFPPKKSAVCWVNRENVSLLRASVCLCIQR